MFGTFLCKLAEMVKIFIINVFLFTIETRKPKLASKRKEEKSPQLVQVI